MKDWFFLFRPWSYMATLVPFLVAAGVGCRQDGCRWGPWAVGLVSGLLFQSTVNLLNTWGDERSGVDDVPGAIRTTPQIHEGKVSMRALLTAALVCLFLATALGLGLCFTRENGAWHVNVPLLVAGFLGFLGATNYTTGIRFKYHGLGVPFVSFLMGPLEIFVAYAILLPAAAARLPSACLASPRLLLTGAIAILPLAALVGVVMHGNDMRDIPTDRAAGIVTLASALGPRGALIYYCLCHTVPALVCLAALAVSPWALLPLLAVPLSVRTMSAAVRTYRANPALPVWRGLEKASGGILLVFGVLYSLALALR